MIDDITELHCIGGFAVVQAYGLERSTADIDVISEVPYGSNQRLFEVAGKESALHRKHGIYLDIVTVASVPEDYQARLIAIYPTCWERLRLFALGWQHQPALHAARQFLLIRYRRLRARLHSRTSY